MHHFVILTVSVCTPCGYNYVVCARGVTALHYYTVVCTQVPTHPVAMLYVR